jgi:hypothetical protein
MSNGELPHNPQPLHQTLQESAELVNELYGFNVLNVPLAGAIYDFFGNIVSRQESQPDRLMVGLFWKSGSELMTNDGRTVTSMRLDVAANPGTYSTEPVQTYRFACYFNVMQLHTVAITANTAQQQVDIRNERRQVIAIVNGRPRMITPIYWKPIPVPDVESLLTVFHDALEVVKPIVEEVKRG